MIVRFKDYDESVSRELWHFNTLAYCSKKILEKWAIGSPLKEQYDQVSDITVYENADTANQAFLAFNSASKTIYLIFRGSIISFHNWILQNFKFLKVPFTACKNCNVHRGFYQAYNNLDIKTIMSDLKALKTKHSESKVIVSGHSLGGAMANFGFLDACDTLKHVDLFITYGAPRVGDENFSNHFDTLKCGAERVRVVNHRDPIPHIPPMRFGFRHAHSEVYYESENDPFVYCKEFEDTKCSAKFSLSAVNILDHLTYMKFNQWSQSLKCNKDIDVMDN